ncbi:MAG: TolC family protein [Pirellulales bacterium]
MTRSFDGNGRLPAKRRWRTGIAALLIGSAGCAAPHHEGSASVAQPTQSAVSIAAAKSGSVSLSPLVPVASSNGSVQLASQIENVPAKPLPSSDPPPDDRYPIDLVTALRLAGADNLEIALAAERVRQAQARLEAANVLWLPSIAAGAGYARHTGRIQDTAGNVIEVSRNSLFVGGGPTVGSIGVAGAAAQPRMTVGLSLADAFFAPLAERQAVRGANAAGASKFNDTLLQVALAYLDLLHAQGQVAIAREAVTNAQELERLVDARVRAGTTLPTDGLRARAELAERRRLLFQTEESVRVASTELVRLLRLDPAVTLTAAEDQPSAITLIEAETPLVDLIGQAVAQRPELAQQQALVSETLERLRQEHRRPLLPSVQVGFGAGGFGGGEGSSVRNFSDRADFDALVVWELRNLGLGNGAANRERFSQHMQSQITAEQTRDRIAAEVTRGYYQVQYRRQQIDAAIDQVKVAAEALPLNFKGIQGGELRAIEAQQAVQTLALARARYLAAVIEHNAAQFQLLRAVGQPPEALPSGSSK